MRFSVKTIFAIPGQLSIGVIGAVVYRINFRTLPAKLVGHPGMERMHLILRIKTAGDARLVRDDKDSPPAFIEAANAISDALNPDEVALVCNIATIFIDDAVAVEKEGR